MEIALVAEWKFLTETTKMKNHSTASITRVTNNAGTWGRSMAEQTAIEQLEAENAELRERLAKYELVLNSEKKVAKTVGYLSLAVLLGPGLSHSLRKWYARFDSRTKSIPVPESIDVVAAVIRRLTAVGVVGVILAALPLVLLYQQNNLVSAQNEKIEKQNELLTSQDAMIKKQTALAETQTSYFETQNLHMVRQNLFSHSLQLQTVWVEHPELLPYFYDGVELDEDTDEDDRRRVYTMCEMLADMLDNAAASELKAMTAEGWGNYAVDMTRTSPAFKGFLANPSIQKWYPSIGKWIDFEALRPPDQNVEDQKGR
ncbi:MAG: hypothetical protein R3B90_17365 [Planctomycetaceae bacterium]